MPLLALGVALLPARAVATSSPPLLTLAASAAAAADGTVVLRGAVTVDRRPSRGVTVTALVRPVGADAWSHVGSARTDAEGVVAVAVPLRRTSDVLLSVDYAGGVATSPARRVLAGDESPLTARWEPAAVAVGEVARLAGTAGASTPGERVQLQRWLRARWTPVTSTAVDDEGAFGFPLTSASVGTSVWRVVRPSPRSEVTAPVTLEVYREHTYEVRTRGLLDVDAAAFARAAAATWADRRGWSRAHLRFREVPSGGDFTLVLSAAAYLPRYDRTCTVTYSCQADRYVVINATRWRYGATAFRVGGGSIGDYRRMVLNHELGHWLGEHHVGCPARGTAAPLMMQQSKALGGCRANAWPLAAELRGIAPARR